MISDKIASLIMIDLLNEKRLKFMGFGIKLFLRNSRTNHNSLVTYSCN